MPGEASITFEVVGTEARDGDLDLVGLACSRFLDGLLHVSPSTKKMSIRICHAVSPRPQSLASSRRVEDAGLIESQASIALPGILRFFASNFGVKTCLTRFE